jgi:hypothetical protein
MSKAWQCSTCVSRWITLYHQTLTVLKIHKYLDMNLFNNLKGAADIKIERKYLNDQRVRVQNQSWFTSHLRSPFFTLNGDWRRSTFLFFETQIFQHVNWTAQARSVAMEESHHRRWNSCWRLRRRICRSVSPRCCPN